MSRLALIIAVVALTLTACASVGAWRTVSIDSSSESTFRDSVTRLDSELPGAHRQMFRLALVDIARTGVQNASDVSEDSEQAYTDEDFRDELDGLNYEGVVALADRTGQLVEAQYRAANGQRWAEARHAAERNASQPYQRGLEFRPVQNPGLILSDAWKPNNGR